MSNKERLLLEHKLANYERENRRLHEFSQACLDKIGKQEIMLRELYNELDRLNEIKERLRELI